MSAKAEILARVRAAVTDLTAPLGARGETPWVDQAAASPAETIELFVENVIDYKAEVVRVAPDGVGGAIGDALTAYGASSVVVPSGLDPAWVSALGEEVRIVADEGLGSLDLDAIDSVITASAVSIATTGTIVLDHGPDQGRRALSLVPDVHVCVVRASQVVHDVPEAVFRLHPQEGMPRPLTWISGPSATSDIELDRVEGVHGPRTLHVILIEE
ncbi:MAG: lactate utilization protein C [Dermatophilaceae bacterium]